ncbi:MAG: MaoC family dehydratase N-terminal domain-containing protein [Sphingorhabdus sp.]
MGAWDAWIGREEVRTDRIDAGFVSRWLATFDRDAPEDGHVPQGFHWCLCLPDAATGQLGNDGHPLRLDGPESFLPPLPLPRRMWASSKVEFLTPLKLGDAVTRTSRVLSITEKTGGSGQLVFVDVAHDIAGDAGIAIREVQSIVYRDAAAPDPPLSPPAAGNGRFDVTCWSSHRMLMPSAALLFRYSALTFNSHRIHYDLPYAQGEERYRGLVVHGPLTATLLLDLARREFGDNALTNFNYRGLSPAICGESLHLVMRRTDTEIELAAFASDGRQVTAATAMRKD